MWRIESVLGSARGVDVRAMCQLYDANAELTGALAALVSETKRRGGGTPTATPSRTGSSCT
ncbi:hypothetical protein [Micromonospora robiginosa]|uniref:Uncharacterized protein n=1 Tax=Micromonospora robiginosa TaxID=2749844 RepID=A0AAF0NZC6_9ACTN|nr:hypothetical protein [Micromonospora ferruginea]WMF04576.1 hypothetical protein H1D33_30280 [Micromonospora ferruginea]